MLSQAATTISVYQPIIEKVIEPNFPGLAPGDWVQIGVGFATLIVGGIAARNWRISHYLDVHSRFQLPYHEYLSALVTVTVLHADDIRDWIIEVYDYNFIDNSNDLDKLRRHTVIKVKKEKLINAFIPLDARYLINGINRQMFNFYAVPFLKELESDLREKKGEFINDIKLILDVFDQESLTREQFESASKAFDQFASQINSHKLLVELRIQMKFFLWLDNRYGAQLTDYPFSASLFSSIRPNEFFLYQMQREISAHEYQSGTNSESVLDRVYVHTTMRNHEKSILNYPRRLIYLIKKIVSPFIYRYFLK